MKNIVIGLTAIAATICIAEELDYEKEGGLVKLSGKGFVAAIDCRETVNPSDYVDGMKAVADTLLIKVTDSKGIPFTFQNAATQLRTSGGNCAVFIVDDPTLPMTLSSPEEKWSLVNVSKIGLDSPSQEKFMHRVSVLFARQAFRALGADETKGENSCFYTAFKVSDLDKITGYDLPMGADMALPVTMTSRGIEKIEYGTYEEACLSGVAAQPTNAVQRAIWDKIHQLPSEPIKIKPETKKVTE